MFAINNRSMAMDDRFYYRPTEFLPERWLRETTGEIAKSKEFPFAHKPFGFGPRACIGQRFAENEIFIAATKVFKHVIENRSIMFKQLHNLYFILTYKCTFCDRNCAKQRVYIYIVSAYNLSNNAKCFKITRSDISANGY